LFCINFFICVREKTGTIRIEVDSDNAILGLDETEYKEVAYHDETPDEVEILFR